MLQLPRGLKKLDHFRVLRTGLVSVGLAVTGRADKIKAFSTFSNVVFYVLWLNTLPTVGCRAIYTVGGRIFKIFRIP